MLSFFNAKIWLHPEPIYFRKQIDGLVLIVADHLKLDPVSGQIFLFRNRNRDKLKALYWEHKEPIKRVAIIPVKNKICSCGREKKVIRYEVREYYHHVPAIFEKIEQRREVVACTSGCAGSLEAAKEPDHVLPKIQASHSLLSHIIVSKFIDRQPLYHLEKQFKQRFGVDITRQQMANWLILLKPKLQPLLNLLKDEIIDYDIASMDATQLQVLREPGRPPTRQSYAYCFRGGPPSKKVLLFEYNAEKHKPFVANWFAGFQGIIHSDADPFFDLLSSHIDVDLSYCNAHARRKFEPIAKAVKTDCNVFIKLSCK